MRRIVLEDCAVVDVLLVTVCARKAPQTLSLESCCAAAVEKVRRRCEYFFDAEGACTVQEAEAAWQRAKQLERHPGLQSALGAPLRNEKKAGEQGTDNATDGISGIKLAYLMTE